MSMKKIARLFHLSNDMYPTIESSLSSLSANCIAACSSDLSPIIPFVIYSSEALSSLYYNTRSVYLHHTPLVEQIKSGEVGYQIPFHQRGDKKVDSKRESIKADSELTKKITESITSFNGDFMARVLLAPRPLGGFSILQLPNLLIRKFPDPKAFSVATLRAIYQDLPRGKTSNH